MRIGHGYDVHRLKAGRPLVLAGVEIPNPVGLDGHSDADVLLHAVMDALLGAAGLPDIGRQFPDTDEQYRGISSVKLTRQVCALVRQAGWEIENVDVTMVAQRPKLSPYLQKMRESLAAALETAPERVNIKATTEEHLGFTGREEGMACHAVCLLRRMQA